MKWILLGLLLLPSPALAGVFEISVGGSYTMSTYSANNFYWEQRLGASVGYHFSEYSEMEISFQDVVERTSIPSVEDTTFHDQIYSLDWVQAFTGKSSPVQPYVKLGVGQLDRDATGTYSAAGSTIPVTSFGQITGILGVGLKIFITHNFALRGEGTTYLVGGDINSWSQNLSGTLGVSLYF